MFWYVLQQSAEQCVTSKVVCSNRVSPKVVNENPDDVWSTGAPNRRNQRHYKEQHFEGKVLLLHPKIFWGAPHSSGTLLATHPLTPG